MITLDELLEKNESLKEIKHLISSESYNKKYKYVANDIKIFFEKEIATLNDELLNENTPVYYCFNISMVEDKFGGRSKTHYNNLVIVSNKQIISIARSGKLTISYEEITSSAIDQILFVKDLVLISNNNVKYKLSLDKDQQRIDNEGKKHSLVSDFEYFYNEYKLKNIPEVKLSNDSNDNTNSKLDEIVKLKSLLDSNAITVEEYDKLKKEIVDK